MRNLRMISAVSIVLACAPCAAQEWISYTSAADRFRILVPGELEVRDIDYPSEYGAVFPARVYSFDDGRILDAEGNRIRYRELSETIKVRNAPGRTPPQQ